MLPPIISRRAALSGLAACAGGALLPQQSFAAKKNEKWEKAIKKGLEWVAKTQSRIGQWNAGNYPTAMTALAGLALTAAGSTTVQGPYAKQIRSAVDYLQTKSRDNGLIGDPQTDNRYTYGHGFAMLFLSQVLGEEEDEERREELINILTKACRFSGSAQTDSGGWGYVSAKEDKDFDEGSTTITQVQGLRACRGAGIQVPAEIIDKAKAYIFKCQNADGGISYSTRNHGTSRAAITAAAIACLYNAGDYDNKKVPEMLAYCKKNLVGLSDGPQSFGHWHYTYLYYSQVMYRQKKEEWEAFRDKLYDKIVSEQKEGESYWDGPIGPIYVTACNLIMLQLDLAYLPIYQR